MTDYSSTTKYESTTPFVPTFCKTKFDETATRIPRGKVKMTPVPMVAGPAQRRMSLVGFVGDVAHAKTLCVVPAGEAGSSASRVTGEVGVTPFAAGRPRLYWLAVPMAMKMPASKTAARSVDVVVIV